MKLGALACILAFSWFSVTFQQNFARERSGQSAALKDALEGKAPPPIRVKTWLNVGDKPPTWESLRKKVVLVEFWAHW